MEVREGMSKVVLSVGPGHTLREAARRMTDSRVGAAIVVNDDGQGPGIVSERDILHAIGGGQDPDAELVADHMSESVITADPGWSLERAATEMATRHIRHLLIVEGGEMVGVLSMRDVMRVWSTAGATSTVGGI